MFENFIEDDMDLLEAVEIESSFDLLVTKDQDFILYQKQKDIYHILDTLSQKFLLKIIVIRMNYKNFMMKKLMKSHF